MILEFASFWLVAPEIIGESRLKALGKWLHELNRQMDSLASNRWVRYVMPALLFSFAAYLASSPSAEQRLIYPGGWAFTSATMSIAVIATFAVIYSQFAFGIWFVASGWLNSILPEFKITGRLVIIGGYTLFTLGLGIMTFELIQALWDKSEWWLALIVFGWGITCVMFWVLLTFHLTNWWAWLSTVLMYDFGTWAMLYHIAGGTASWLGGVAVLGVVTVNLFASVPLVERFVALLVRKRPLRMQLLFIGAVIYVVSFLLQLVASF